ncbi:MAG TPA: hypothetical protein VIM92_07220 [Rhodanobacteraceae bacterium]
MLRVALFASLCLAAISPCFADAGAADSHHEGHPSESAGKVHFAVSCSTVQADFDRALAMLHSFWYEKAQQHFDAITKWDPACAMAWWGLAMTNWHPLWDRPNAQALAHGRDALANARSASEISPRERAFIQALGAFYTTDGDYLARAHAYERAMARVHATYPADKTYAREKQSAQLLNGVLAREPDHPGALHYLIHAYNSPPLAHYALAAARTYARIAPSVPHAQHMPSHIFVRLGLWQETIASNQAAEAAAKRFAAEMRLPGAWDEQLHAMDYLGYAWLQRGDDAPATQVQDQVRAIKHANPENFKVAYAYAAIPARAMRSSSGSGP